MMEKKDKILELENKILKIEQKFSAIQVVENKTADLKTITFQIYGALIVALIGIIGNFLNSWKQSDDNIYLEKIKLKGELISKAFDATDTIESKKRLLFFIHNKLINDDDSLLIKSANDPNNLPSGADFNASNEMPTVSLASNRFPCKSGRINGCWKTSLDAYLGDTIAVQIFYRNTSAVLSSQTSLFLKPQRASGFHGFLFIGGISGFNLHPNIGVASLTLKDNQAFHIKSINDGAWYTSPRTLHSFNQNSLFGNNGLNIGPITSGTQGVLTIRFAVTK